MKHVLSQFARYAIVGLASNAIGYLLYLGLTNLGLGHKLAMSLLYGIGVLQTFVFNRKWSFRFEGAARPALIRYATAYGFGYVIRFATAFEQCTGNNMLSRRFVSPFSIFRP